jgi:hypothetical protein
VCDALAAASLGPVFDDPDRPHWTRRLFPPGHYVAQKAGREYEESILTWLRVGGRGMCNPETGAPVDAFGVILNTAMTLGGDAVRLMARIHAQCEIHGFIPPESADFVVGIIEQGRKTRLCRDGMGWEAVTALLKASAVAKLPVVMSYSVTDTFPGWDAQKDEPKTWDVAFAELDGLLAIREETWKDYHFGDGSTLLSLEPRTP